MTQTLQIAYNSAESLRVPPELSVQFRLQAHTLTLHVLSADHQATYGTVTVERTDKGLDGIESPASVFIESFTNFKGRPDAIQQYLDGFTYAMTLARHIEKDLRNVSRLR